MKDWITRHVVLTREERLLIAGILFIALCGLAGQFLLKKSPVPEVRKNIAAVEPN